MKKLWKQNRVLFVLIIILCICFIAICSVAITFFYAKDVDSYGTRLSGIDKYPVKSEFKTSYKETVLENENVTKVDFNIRGRIIYVHITFSDEIDVEKAKEVAEKSLSLFSEEIISYYDIEFVLKSDSFTIIGAKNFIIDHVAWNNNIEVEQEETDEK